MAFPTTPTAVRVDLNLGGSWVNVTGDVQVAESIQITRGRTDEASSPQPSSCHLTLSNRTGNYTPRNPMGAYYGLLGRNTPIRVGVGVPPAGAGTGNQTGASLVAPASTAEQAGMAISMWAVEAPTATITAPAGYTPTGLSTGGLMASRAAVKLVSAGAVPVATATSSVSAAYAAATCVIPGGASVIASGNVNSSYSFGGAFAPAQLGVFALAAGDVLVACITWSQDPNNAMVCSPWDDTTTSEWALTADSGQSTANSPRVQIWTRYCPVAVSAYTMQAMPWYSGAADLQMSVLQVRGAASWNPRFHGFCMDFTSTADLSGNDVRCAIEAGSVLRQRGQGTQTPHSAFFRYLSNSDSVAYWPLEGGTLTGALASPINGVPQALIPPGTGTIEYGQDTTSFTASDALPVLTSTYVQGYTPAYTAGLGGGAYGASYVQAAPTALNQGLLWALFAGGTIGTICITYTSTSSWTCQVFNTAGVKIADSGAIGGTVMVGVPRVWYVTWNPNPTNPATQTDFGFGYIDCITNLAPAFSFIGVTGTVGTCSRVSVGQETTNTSFFDGGITVGHMAVARSGSNAASGTYGPTSTFPRQISVKAAIGWRIESGQERFLRICQEESIPLSAPIFQATTSASIAQRIILSDQLVDNALGILAVTQATDMGEMAESRCSTGLMYRTGASLTGQAVTAQIDYAGRMIAGRLQPVDDDQLTRNDITVTQQGGSSVEAYLPSGNLSIMNPPQGVGIYTQSVDVNVYYQSKDLPQIAALYLAQGTVDQQRFKSVSMLLEAVPGSVTLLSSLDIGNRAQIINTPVWVQPGPSDVIILGLTERIGPIAEWHIDFNAKPYGVNAVMKLDGTDVFARLDSGSATLQTAMNTTIATATVNLATNIDAWGTLNLPYDILVGGERMTVTGVTGTTSPQVLSVTRSVNGVVKTHATGETVHVFWQTYAGLAAI